MPLILWYSQSMAYCTRCISFIRETCPEGYMCQTLYVCPRSIFKDACTKGLAYPCCLLRPGVSLLHLFWKGLHTTGQSLRSISLLVFRCFTHASKSLVKIKLHVKVHTLLLLYACFTPSPQLSTSSQISIYYCKQYKHVQTLHRMTRWN